MCVTFGGGLSDETDSVLSRRYERRRQREEDEYIL